MNRLVENLDNLRFYSTLEVLRLLPFQWIVRWLRLSSGVACRLSGGERSRAAEWLRETIPGDARLASGARGLVREQFTNAAYRRYLSYLLMTRDAREFSSIITIEGWDRLEAASSQKRGVVLLSSKVGFPRLLRWYLRTRELPVLYMLRIGYPGKQDRSLPARFQRWHRARYHLDDDDLCGNEELSVQYMKRAYRHLQRNGIVNIAGDGSAGGERCPVTIRGREQTFALGGLALGVMNDSPILPCFTSVEAGPRFRIEIQEPLPRPEPSSDRSGQLRSLARTYAARIDDYILRHPSNVVMPRYSLRFPA